jgi:CRP/FNR family transcriptional regulator, cyclic AMP receptor protein
VTTAPTLPPFRSLLDDSARAELDSLGRRSRYPVGAYVLREGDSITLMGVVIEGLLKVVMHRSDGRAIVLGVVGPGDLIGEIAALDGEPRAASVIALTQTEVRLIPNEVFVDFRKRRVDVTEALLALVVSRVRTRDQALLDIGTSDGVGRMCRRLVDLADRFGTRDAAGVVAFESPVNQSDMAAWAGMSREAVVKALSSLRRLGWVENTGNTYRLLDAAAIRARAS